MMLFLLMISSYVILVLYLHNWIKSTDSDYYSEFEYHYGKTLWLLFERGLDWYYAFKSMCDIKLFKRLSSYERKHIIDKLKSGKFVDLKRFRREFADSLLSIAFNYKHRLSLMKIMNSVLKRRIEKELKTIDMDVIHGNFGRYTLSELNTLMNRLKKEDYTKYILIRRLFHPKLLTVELEAELLQIVRDFTNPKEEVHDRHSYFGIFDTKTYL